MNWSSDNRDISKNDESILELQRQRQLMEKTVPVVVLKLEKELPPLLKNWIKETLTGDNLDEIRKLYNTALEKFVEESKTDFDKSLWNEFKNLFEEASQKTCKAPLDKIAEMAEKFNNLILETFNEGNCFSDPGQLEITGRKKLKIVTKTLEPGFELSVVEELGEKLMEIYKQKNELILAAKTVNTKKVVESIRRVYSKEMDDLLSKGKCFSPEFFLKFHDELEKKCLDIFEKIFSSGETAVKISDNYRAHLQLDLYNDFKRYQKENQIRLFDWENETGNRLDELLKETTSEIKEFTKKKPNILTHSCVREIYNIAKMWEEEMDCRSQLFIRVGRTSLLPNSEWLSTEASFDKVWIEGIYGNELSGEEREAKVCDDLINVYYEEMLKNLKVKRNNDDEIIPLHNNLVEECLTVFGKILSHGGQGQYQYEKKTDAFKNQLELIFQMIKATKEHFSQYIQQISSCTFEGQHLEAMKQTVKLFKIEAKEKFGSLGTMLEDILTKELQWLENQIQEKLKAITGQRSTNDEPIYQNDTFETQTFPSASTLSSASPPSRPPKLRTSSVRKPNEHSKTVKRSNTFK